MSGERHERPGVYSSYDMSGVVRTGAGAAVGIAGLSQGGTAGALYQIARYEDAESALGRADGLCALVKLLLENGASQVWAVPVREEGDYTAAFETLAGVEQVAVVTCDSAELSVQQALRDSVVKASAQRRERIAVVSGGRSEQVEALTSRAAGLNSERVVLVGPGGPEYAAAAAGAIAGERDPAVPMGGAELAGVPPLGQRYGENELDLLIRGGVTPLEEMSGIVSIVRGVTTRTKTGETADSTWKELTTIRVVDDVIPAVREALRIQFRRAKNTEQSRGAIRSRVILELENKLRREIITGYDNVTVEADREDPTVCVVEFAFTATHGLNQIWLTAHIKI